MRLFLHQGSRSAEQRNEKSWLLIAYVHPGSVRAGMNSLLLDMLSFHAMNNTKHLRLS